MNRIPALIISFVLAMFICGSSIASAHPGKTDENGGHYDAENGEYHYHHGYPAHQHYDIDGDGKADCPYDFDDKTGWSSGSSNGAGTFNGKLYSKDYLDGYSSGHEDGYYDGYSDGKTAGYSDGKADGYSAGKKQGFSDGHAKGYSTAKSNWSLISVGVGVGTATISSLTSRKRKKRDASTITFLKTQTELDRKKITDLQFKEIELKKVIAEKDSALKAKEQLPSTLSTVESARPGDSATPAYRVCHFVWTRSIIFCEKMQQKPSLRCEVYLWTAFFYSITKHMGNQALVDEIYTQFKPAAESFITDHKRKEETRSYIQSSYWKFRNVLNASNVNPQTQDGIDKLWELTVQWAYPDTQLPENAKDSFIYNVRLLVKHALTQCGIMPPEETVYYLEAANGMIVPVPESKLDAWMEEQDRLERNPAPVELTEAEKKLRDAILNDLYGNK